MCVCVCAVCLCLYARALAWCLLLPQLWWIHWKSWDRSTSRTWKNETKCLKWLNYFWFLQFFLIPVLIRIFLLTYYTLYPLTDTFETYGRFARLRCKQSSIKFLHGKLYVEAQRDGKVVEKWTKLTLFMNDPQAVTKHMCLLDQCPRDTFEKYKQSNIISILMIQYPAT